MRKGVELFALRVLFLLVFSISFGGGPVNAGAITDFESYVKSSDWNAYILGDVVDYSNSGDNQTDIEGAVAIGGSLGVDGGSIPSLTIGAKLATTPGFDGTQTTLVVRNNLFNRNNQIHGSVYAGGNAALGGGPEYGGGFTVTGNLTVGGNLDFNASNSGGQIGQQVDGNGLPAATLVGGDILLGRGSNIFGSVQGNGNIVVNGDGMGDTDAIIAAGTFLHNNATPYLNGIATQNAAPFVVPDSPVDFDAMSAGLVTDSLAMSLLTPNASWQINDGTRYGTVLDAISTGAASDELIVFDLGSDPSLLWQDGFFIDADEDRNILINIGGLSQTITNFAFSYSPALSFDNVLFNFYEATEIFLGMADNSSGIGFNGNILAPLAHVSFYNSLLQGNLVAASLEGNGQINLMRKPGAVPEPGILFLLLLGLAACLALRHRSPATDF